MEQMDPEYKEFIDAAVRAIEFFGIEDVAEKYGCSASFLYQIINGQKSAGRKTQLKLAKACGEKTTSNFLKKWSGVADKVQRTTPIANNVFSIDQVTKEHIELVQKFKNKEIALAINQKLMELENVNPIAFARAVGDIDTIINNAISNTTQALPPRKTGTDEN